MIVKIKRQDAPDTLPYWQSFEYKGEAHVTVSAVLDALNYTDDLFDIEGKPARRSLTRKSRKWTRKSGRNLSSLDSKYRM